jgi:hypothetical protein
MKTYALILAVGFMAYPLSGITQQIPLFQFTLYFEDSVGNRDSLVLGSDPSASSQDIDPQFGEVELSSPFDSVFEVRAVHFLDDNLKTLKTIIVQSDTIINCVKSLGAIILVQTKFPPVKINYDNILFPDNACGNIILTRDWDIFFLEEWWDICKYHCMSDSSDYLEDFADPEPPFNQCWNYLKKEKEVQGQGLKELPGLFLATFYGPGPCNDPTFLHTDQSPDTDGGALYPNPCGEYFMLETAFSESIARLIVVNVAGEIMSCPTETSLHKVRVDASGLQPGMYFVLGSDEWGRSFIQKVVKN